jgi:hypothetical protein
MARDLAEGCRSPEIDPKSCVTPSLRNKFTIHGPFGNLLYLHNAIIMFSTSTAVLFVLTILKSVRATPCLAFDINFNLFVFGLSGNDYNAGTQDTWDTRRFLEEKVPSFLRDALAYLQIKMPR